jgi:hypothetical protein
LSTGTGFYDINAAAICGTQSNVNGSRVAANLSGSVYALVAPFQSVTSGTASYATSSAASGVLWQTSPEMAGWFRLDDTSNVAVKISLSSTSAGTNCTTNLSATNQDEATWKLDTSTNANWQYCSGSGSAVTCANGPAADTNWHYFKVEVVPDSTLSAVANITFTLDSTTYTSSTNLPDLGVSTTLLPTICLDQTDDTGTVNLYSPGWIIRSY